MNLVLLQKSGKDVNRRFVLAANVVTVGTTPPADIVVSDDPLIDPQHFRIERTGEGGCQIRDLGSQHGTWMGGKRISVAPLRERDIVRAGLTMFQVLYQSDGAEESAERIVATAVVEPRSEAQGTASPAVEAGQLAAAPSANHAFRQEIAARLAAAMARAGFELAEQLGHGSFGRVHRATRVATGENVAIKIFEGRPDQFSKRWRLFLREMQVHRKLDHPHIVRQLATCLPEDDVGWFAMEYVAGPNLEKLVQTTGVLSILDACDIVRQVLSGLDDAHTFPAPDGPFVHRDIKPGNIVVEGLPGCYRAKLCDFGVAKNFELAGLSGLTTTGVATGTIGFMSPEQLADSKYSGPEVDLHATAGVLYFALTGHLMYDIAPGAAPSELLHAVLESRTVPLRQRRADVPEELETVIERATGRDHVRRFRTAQQMLHAIDQVIP